MSELTLFVLQLGLSWSFVGVRFFHCLCLAN
jgi:hypothetical protein